MQMKTCMLLIIQNEKTPATVTTYFVTTVRSVAQGHILRFTSALRETINICVCLLSEVQLLASTEWTANLALFIHSGWFKTSHRHTVTREVRQTERRLGETMSNVTLPHTQQGRVLSLWIARMASPQLTLPSSQGKWHIHTYTSS